MCSHNIRIHKLPWSCCDCVQESHEGICQMKLDGGWAENGHCVIWIRHDTQESGVSRHIGRCIKGVKISRSDPRRVEVKIENEIDHLIHYHAAVYVVPNYIGIERITVAIIGVITKCECIGQTIGALIPGCC